jgi:protein-disulfide isomerase
MRFMVALALLCRMTAPAQTPTVTMTDPRTGEKKTMPLKIPPPPSQQEKKAAPKAQPKQVNWQTLTELNQVDFSGLTAAQKKAALDELRADPCTCGCDMKLAECRVKDPSCGDSRGLAEILIKALREGRDPLFAMNNSDIVARRSGAPNILEKPVPIPIQGAPSKGPANARLVMVEFSDFECGFCAKAAAKIDAILKAYPNDVRLVYKQYPISTHPNAAMAAAASLAAHAQNKFWPMHDQLFANGTQLSAKKISEVAKAIGLDMPRFDADLKAGKFKIAVNKDVEDGNKIAISGTPTVFINGKRYNGSLEMAVLKPILDAELKVAK